MFFISTILSKLLNSSGKRPNLSIISSLNASISLLSPGRGLKGAKYEEMAYNYNGNWSTHIYLKSKIGKALVESTYALSNNLRTIEYNGSKIRNTELTALANIIWLTPQMDGIFVLPLPFSPRITTILLLKTNFNSLKLR